MRNALLRQSARYGKHLLSTFSIAGLALLLLMVTLWGPENIRTVLYLGAPGLILLLVLYQWVSMTKEMELSRHLEQQLLDFNLLLKSGKAITSQFFEHRLEDIYSSAVRIAHRLLQADVVALSLCNNDGTFTYIESYGRRAEILKGRTLPLDEGGLCGWIAKNQQALVVADLQSDPRIIRELANQLEVTTAVGVPILGEGGIIGGISVFRRGRPYHPYDAQFLTIFAHHVGIAIENAKTTTALESRLEELKRTQAQLVQSEKMAAVGQLVSGVAHELNNPLTSILGFAEMLKDQPTLDVSTRRDLNLIYEEADRSKRIIQNLWRFSRQERSSRELANINDVLTRTMALREYQLRLNNINIIKDLASSLPMSVMNVHDLEQVFINIIINAEQAILDTHQDGEITVTTRLESPKEMMISFKDNGPGISPEVLPKIFEPFFTTKEVGRGTGLGLSLSYGIVKQHGGSIRVESKGGRGACFIITLPVTTESYD